MAPVYRLKQDIGMDRPADLDDVWVTKQNLHLNGYYEMPECGLTPFPDLELFGGIKKYQSEHDFGSTGSCSLAEKPKSTCLIISPSNLQPSDVL